MESATETIEGQEHSKPEDISKTEKARLRKPYPLNPRKKIYTKFSLEEQGINTHSEFNSAQAILPKSVLFVIRGHSSLKLWE